MHGNLSHMSAVLPWCQVLLRRLQQHPLCTQRQVQIFTDTGLTPLIPGESDIDQLGRVVKMFGSLESGWPGVCLLPDYGKIQFPKSEGIPLADVLPDASEGAQALLEKLLQVNPGGDGVQTAC